MGVLMFLKGKRHFTAGLKEGEVRLQIQFMEAWYEVAYANLDFLRIAVPKLQQSGLCASRVGMHNYISLHKICLR